MYTRQLVISSARMNLCSRLFMRTLHNKPKEADLTSEVEIPMPWGKINGKFWGSQDKQPILAMHGWQDNAASYNLLAPLIAKNTPVLSIDLPGHGLSSWLPPGSIYTEVVYLASIKRVMKYFGWKKVKLMAHSLSSMTSYWFTATFPKEVQYVICLDFFKFPSLDANYYADALGKAINSLIKLEESTNSQLSYSEAEIKRKWLGGIANIDDASCDILMTRGVRQKEDGTR
ncbi:PREDICTED: serine hydrolase-like protein isoform X2 [Dinoponera quadriceps]|uniref:Serine hydrolase-like protein isoform X2 n=1 Tax=Dinoponera quadriceps TaxID=609295 RepID=A0A6P3XQB0_DINQU|nr:PREDICTED: serine hydrolase-like protein isoform X2 [Dinoponera quadriceps]